MTNFCSIFRLWILFFCFHRKNYNKAALFWLSNILYWTTNDCKDTYNFYSRSLNVVDEYFVEFVHSLARKSTNPTDTVEQLREKFFSLFAVWERQVKFREAFTPPKNYVFSRRQLTALFSRVASIIVTISSSIANESGAAFPLPRAPGQRRDLSLWKVLALFGNVLMKTDFMPLGFQFSPHPNQGKRCDLPDCIILSDTPWKIFEGCWYSFHLSCLDVADVCPICRTGIETAISSLATIANKYIHPQENLGDCTGEVDTAAGDADSGNNGDDDDLLTSPVNANIDQLLQNLTHQVMALSVRSPPVQPLSPTTRSTSSSQPLPRQSSLQRRPPHCTTCCHLMQGHQRLLSNRTSSKFCPVCPSNVCTREGHSTPCVCQWCSRHL